MPILRKKSSRKVTTKAVKKGDDNVVGDVTVDDFANSSRSRMRCKKATTDVTTEVKQTVTTEADQFWTDMDDTGKIHSCGINKSKKKGKGTNPNQRRGKKAKSPEKDTEEAGIDYPLDVWFLISEYISPEAIGKFARICRSSYHVTTTGKFWFHLYKSYYKFVPGLPERLQPQCMVRTHGLRACVIRTLHYTYFALKREVDDVSYLRQAEPHSLVRRRCNLMWHKKGKMRWYFFFKLKEIPKSSNTAIKRKLKGNSKKTDFLEMLEDVAVNPEEDCKVLRVTCLKYSMLPPVTGLILQTVSVTLMPGFKDHRLQLGFGTSDVPNTLTNQVILNYVINYQVLDWWHPSYPHQDGILTIELPENESWD